MALSLSCRLQENAVLASLSACSSASQQGRTASGVAACHVKGGDSLKSFSLTWASPEIGSSSLRRSHGNAKPGRHPVSNRRRRQITHCKAAVKEAEHSTANKTARPHVAQTEQSMLVLHDEADRLAKELSGTNIFLIGMMGCGKTTVGRILSDVLGYGFFDSDSAVEQAVGTTVAKIFSEQGEAAFRDLESQAVSQLASMEGLVVATGGGAILRPENWRCMSSGVVVWIDVPLHSLAERVVAAGVGSRPILSQGASNQDVYSQALDRLTSVYEKRKHLYPQADVRVSLQDIAADSGASSVAEISAARIVLQVLRGVEKLVKERSLAFAAEPLEECLFNEYGQCVLPYGLEQHSEERSLQRKPVISR